MTDAHSLVQQIQQWSAELGFDRLGITDTDVSACEPQFRQWLASQYHGDMQWLAENLDKRFEPAKLVPQTVRVICVRMQYLPADTAQIEVLKDPDKAYISRYALGRDYHKLVRKRLAQLADKIRLAALETNPSQRAFVDSAPVLERALAVKAGLGWVGKHTLVLDRTGSWFFLGEIYTSLPLPTINEPVEERCGDCTACLKVCPTDAFPRPYLLDARRCISYLTIENRGPIPEEFRSAMGNRVFGCDDCQAICPWNKFAQHTKEGDFKPRHQLQSSDLLTLFLWDEATYLKRTEGSPLRRIGYELWLRNLAVGLGNAPPNEAIINALTERRENASALLREHIDWALARQREPQQKRRRKLKNPERQWR